MAKAKVISAFDRMAKHSNETKALIQEILDYWLPVLGLDGWAINIDYNGLASSDTSATSAVLARINPSWEYENATIEFFLPSFVECSPRQTEYIVVHELCHALVNPLRPESNEDWNRQNEELTVTRMAKAYLKVRYYKENTKKTGKKPR